MLKISVVEEPRRRRLIVEGKLIAPWADELTSEYTKVKENLDGRKLVVDLRGVSAVNQDGESVLLQLMREKVEFDCGVFMKEVLRELARQSDGNRQHPGDHSPHWGSGR
jgi:anti-anti-sigma regulatory factor